MDALDIIRLRYCEFAQVNPHIKGFYLELVDSQIRTGRWKSLNEQARAALAAHMMWSDGYHTTESDDDDEDIIAELGGPENVSGNIKSVKTGDLSITFADIKSQIIGKARNLEDAVFAQSRFGQDFLRFRQKRIIGAFVP